MGIFLSPQIFPCLNWHWLGVTDSSTQNEMLKCVSMHWEIEGLFSHGTLFLYERRTQNLCVYIDIYTNIHYLVHTYIYIYAKWCVYIYTHKYINIYKYYLTICTLVYPQTEDLQALCGKMREVPSHNKKKIWCHQHYNGNSLFQL